MKIFEYNEAKQVVVCGDIHGAFETMVFKTCVQYGMTDTLVIVAGDCGFGSFYMRENDAIETESVL